MIRALFVLLLAISCAPAEPIECPPGLVVRTDGDDQCDDPNNCTCRHTESCVEPAGENEVCGSFVENAQACSLDFEVPCAAGLSCAEPQSFDSRCDAGLGFTSCCIVLGALGAPCNPSFVQSCVDGLVCQSDCAFEEGCVGACAEP